MNFPCDKIVLDGIQVLPLHSTQNAYLSFRIDTNKKNITFSIYKKKTGNVTREDINDISNSCTLEREITLNWNFIEEIDIQNNDLSPRIVMRFNSSRCGYNFCYLFVSDSEIIKQLHGPLSCINECLMERRRAAGVAESIAQACSNFGALDLFEDDGFGEGSSIQSTSFTSNKSQDTTTDDMDSDDSVFDNSKG